MAVDYFLIYGSHYAPKEFQAWEDAVKAHYDYFFSLDLPNVTEQQDAEGIRLKAAADRAEKAARKAFHLAQSPAI